MEEYLIRSNGVRTTIQECFCNCWPTVGNLNLYRISLHPTFFFTVCHHILSFRIKSKLSHQNPTREKRFQEISDILLCFLYDRLEIQRDIELQYVVESNFSTCSCFREAIKGGAPSVP
jgi:hypothetical protein